MAETLTKGSRITGDDRAALGASLAERYQAGESIRALAEDIGRSFGFVHGVITEAGVTLRGRGGATRGAAASSSAATQSPARRAPARKPTTHPALDPAPAAASTDDGRKAPSKKAKTKKLDSKKPDSKKAKSAAKKGGR